MTSDDTQIIEAYETLNLEPSEIASQLGWSEDAVRLVLATKSRRYYETMNNIQKTPGPAPQSDSQIAPQGDSKTFHEQVYEQAVEVAGSLLHADDENIRARMAKFIINENKGRHDKKQLNIGQLNISIINERMQAVREAKALSKPKAASPIEVPFRELVAA